MTPDTVSVANEVDDGSGAARGGERGATGPDDAFDSPASLAREALLTGGPQVTSDDLPSDGPRAMPTASAPAEPKATWVMPLALLASALALLGNVQGIASGDDGVGYRAIADSLLAGRGFGYFLERPVTIWPPLWPALMAFVARVTPLDTMGAAIVLNAVSVLVAVLVGHRLLRRTVGNGRLVLLGTLVIALGSSTMGFGHLLMTDFAFAVVVMAWMLALMNFHDSGRPRWLLAASTLVWVGFGLRYVSVYLLALGGLWLLLDVRRRFGARLLSAITYGVVGVVAPALWMARNHGVDGTFTGERMHSARGVVDNGFDILATMGRWLLPGVANGATYMWAAIGGVVLLTSAWVGWRVLEAGPRHTAFDGPVRRFLAWLGRPSGLLAVQAFGYLTYMLYVRSTTALNQLDMRLLNPAYLSLLALALVLIDRTSRLGTPARPDPWHRRGMLTAHVWAAANVALGLVAVVSFAAGAPFFSGNYERQLFRDVRANPALAAIPAGCNLYSNLPNALYPRLGAKWSPRRTGLESDERMYELEELVPTLGRRPACLVWIDEEPRYGHIWTLEQLGQRVTLVELARNGDVAVYRIDPPAG